MFLDECRNLEFRASQAFNGKRLSDYIIRSSDVMDKEFCGALCFMEPNCFSYNFMTRSETGKHRCELNNATYEGHEDDMEENQDYVYRGAKVRGMVLFSIYYNSKSDSRILNLGVLHCK